MSGDRRVRVLIVDDDMLVRRALSDYLAVAEDLEDVGACENAQQACTFVAGHPVDVVLMDVRMPVMDGVAGTRWIRAHHPATRVLMLTSFDEDAAIEAALKAGASGFMLKNTPPLALLEAIRAVDRGVHVMSDTPMVRWADQRGEQPRPDSPILADRERQVLAVLCRGASNAEIAAELFLSESAVKAVIAALMRRLDAPSRLKIVVRAHELGLDRPR